MEYFFRSTPEFTNMNGIRVWQIGLMVAAVLGIFGITQINKKTHIKSVRMTMIVMLTVQQLVLYGWYIFSGFFQWDLSLPLFHCRMAIIASIIALITKNRFLQSVLCYWGIIGGVVALSLPDPDPFIFPHITNFSYAVGHLGLLYAVAYMVVIDGFRYTKSSLMQVLIVTNIMHLMILLVNVACGFNYCYLMEPPFEPLKRFVLAHMPLRGYTVIFILLCNLLILMIHGIIKVVEDKRRPKKQVDDEALI